MKIIGLDSAVQPHKNGIVLCEYNDSELSIIHVWDRIHPIEATLTKWMAEEDQVLVCIDSPLGWPAHFSESLYTHKAGMPLTKNVIDFFGRQTDLETREEIAKKPLEVSADRIARTAYFTLQRINEINQILRGGFNLLWEPDELKKYGYIEVYPAATLIANAIDIDQYKTERTVRQRILQTLLPRYNVSNKNGLDILEIDHDFDALICCMAGADFLAGAARGPIDKTDRIIQEGWIWIKDKQHKIG